MTTNSLPQPDRLFDLLATQTTEPLAPADEQELALLLNDAPDVDRDELDSTAAALDLLMLAGEEFEPMPDSVRSRVESSAVAFLAKSHGLKLADAAATDAPPPAETTPARSSGRRTGSTRWPWLAAAACLAIAVLGWMPRLMTQSPEQLYSGLEKKADVTKLTWTDAVNANVTGDLIWDNEAQEGVMRFRGLAANNPTTLQYQLWIFDDGRAAADADGAIYKAVDGGVFDIVPSGGDVFVKIDAKLDISNPSLFAITTEPPGGVVKHITRDGFKIILTAAPKSG